MKLALNRYIALREISALVNELDVGDTLQTAETTTAGNFFRAMMWHVKAKQKFNLTFEDDGTCVIERVA